VKAAATAQILLQLSMRADALLAASVFHFGIHRIGDVKKYLSSHNYSVRNAATPRKAEYGDMSPELKPLRYLRSCRRLPQCSVIPAVAQDVHTGDVLMLAYINAESLAATLTSRSRHIFVAKSRMSSGKRAQHQDTFNVFTQSLSIAMAMHSSSKSNKLASACHTGDHAPVSMRNIELGL
jgi:phosphoribosyl-AMP cyclohydrolase